ncbi:MAG: hypothetical protein SNF33_05120 [Candidatus Algichlamydia australiensis]|nr:hypothetical protein [Chlamydiales bacterium]
MDPEFSSEEHRIISEKEREIFINLGNSFLSERSKSNYSIHEVEKLGKDSFLCVNGKTSTAKQRHKAIFAYIRTFFLQNRYECRRIFFDSKVVIVVAPRKREEVQMGYILFADCKKEEARIVEYGELSSLERELFSNEEKKFVTFRNLETGLVARGIEKEWEINDEISFVQIGGDILARINKSGIEEHYTTPFTTVGPSESEIPLGFEEKYVGMFPSLVKGIIVFYRSFKGENSSIEAASKEFHLSKSKIEIFGSSRFQKYFGKLGRFDWEGVADWTFKSFIEEREIYLIKLRDAASVVFYNKSSKEMVLRKVGGSPKDIKSLLNFPEEIFPNIERNKLEISRFASTLELPVFKNSNYFGKGRVFFNAKTLSTEQKFCQGAVLPLVKFLFSTEGKTTPIGNCLRVEKKGGKKSVFMSLTEEANAALEKRSSSNLSVILEDRCPVEKFLLTFLPGPAIDENKIKIQETRSIFDPDLFLTSRRSVLCLYVNSPSEMSYFSFQDLFASYTGHALVILEKINGARHETLWIDAIRGDNGRLQVRRHEQSWRNNPAKPRKAWEVRASQVDKFMEIFDGVRVGHLAAQQFGWLNGRKDTQNCLSFGRKLLLACGIPEEELPDPGLLENPHSYVNRRKRKK